MYYSDVHLLSKPIYAKLIYNDERRILAQDALMPLFMSECSPFNGAHSLQRWYSKSTPTTKWFFLVFRRNRLGRALWYSELSLMQLSLWT